MSNRFTSFLECLYGLIYLALVLLAVESMVETLIRWRKRERSAYSAARSSQSEFEQQRPSVRQP
jgi:hypothetical protein